MDPSRKKKLVDALQFLRADPRILDQNTIDMTEMQVDALPDSRAKALMERDLGFANKTAKALDKGFGVMGEDAGVDEDAVEAALETIKGEAEAQGRKAWNSEGGQMVRHGAAWALDKLDWLQRKGVREPVESVLGLTPGSAANSHDFHAALERKALTELPSDDVSGSTLDRLKRAFDFSNPEVTAARAIQATKAPIGGALAGAALARSPAGAGIGALIGGVVPEVMRRTGHEAGAEKVSNLIADVGFEPLNAVGLGGAKQGTMGALRRVAGLAKDEAAGAKALAKAEAKLGAEFTPRTGPEIKAEFEAAGVPREALDRALGVKSERLMRSQLEIAGLQPAALAESIARAVGKPGGGEYLGDKAADLLGTLWQEGRSRLRPTARVGTPGVSWDRPLFRETFTQERQRQRFMDIADRQARALAADTTEGLLEAAAKTAPQVRALASPSAQQKAFQDAMENAFEEGNRVGGDLLETKLREIFGVPIPTAAAPAAKQVGRVSGALPAAAPKTAAAVPKPALPIQGENFLREMRPGASRGGEGVIGDVLRGNEIMNKGWQAKNLLGAPSFTVRNISEDLVKTGLAGARPIDFWNSIKTNWRAAKGDPAAAAELKRIVDSGTNLGHSLRQDFSILEGRHEAEKKLAKLFGAKPYSDPGYLAMLDKVVSFLPKQIEKLPWWLPVNRKMLNGWEKIGRTAMWNAGKRAGLPDVLAAERESKMLFDYGRRIGPLDRYLRNIISFLPYKSQAPFAAAQILAENPGGVAALHKIFSAQQPAFRPGQPVPPDWQTSAGATYRLPPEVTDFRRKFVKDPYTSILGPSYGTAPLAPINEIVQPIELGEAALSGFRPGMGAGDVPRAMGEGGIALAQEALKNLQPNWQDILEPIVMQRKLVNGAPIEGYDIFDEYKARALGRLFPSKAIDLGIEKLVNAYDDDAWPDRFIGRYDNVNPEADNDLNFWLLNQLFPGKVTDPNYTQRLKNLTDSRDLAKVLGNFKSDQADKAARDIKKEFPR